MLATTYSRPYGLPLALRCLTALFGMGRGVPIASNHQHKKFKCHFMYYVPCFKLTRSTSRVLIRNITHKNYYEECIFSLRTYISRKAKYVITTFPNRNRLISTPRLNALLRVHLEPINVVICYEPQTIPHLGDGFSLRCFQRLSVPDIATLRCSWRNSSHTSGPFVSVLSY